MKINQKHWKFGAAIFGSIGVVLLVIAVFVDEIRYRNHASNVPLFGDKNLYLEPNGFEMLLCVGKYQVPKMGRATVKQVFGFQSIKITSDQVMYLYDGKNEYSSKYADWSFENDAAKEFKNRGIVWMVFCVLSGLIAVSAIVGSFVMRKKEEMMSWFVMFSSLLLLAASCTMMFLSSKFEDYYLKIGASLILALSAAVCLIVSAQFLHQSKSKDKEGKVRIPKFISQQTRREGVEKN